MGLTQINSSGIENGSIVNADLHSSADIALSKLDTSGTASNSTFLRGDGAWTTVNTDLVSDTSPQLGGDLDVNGNEIVSASNGHIDINPNGTGNISLKTGVGGTTNLTAGGDVVFSSGVTNALCQWDYSQYQLEFWDGVKASFGSDEDLEIYHDGTRSYIQNSTGNLEIQSDNFWVEDKANGHGMIHAVADGGVELYYDNSKKLSTVASGIKVERTDATQSYITMSTSDGDAGYLFGNSNTDIQLMDRDGHPFFKGIKDGGVELYYDNAKKFWTRSGGVQVTGYVVADSFYVGDNEKIYVGAGDDLQIYHNGTNDFIQSNGGYLKIQTDSLKLHDRSDDHPMIEAVNDGAVNLYYDNSKKAETSSSGLLVNNRLQLSGPSIYDKAGTGNSIGIQLSSSGVLPTDGSGTEVNNSKNLGSSSYKWAQVYATTFHGDGSNLTNLPASGIPASGGTFTGDVTFSGGASAIHISGNSDLRFNSGSWTGEHCKIQHHSNWLYIQGGSNGFSFRSSGGTDRWYIDANGNFRPNGNANYNIGESGNRVANLYVNDMHFSNKGKKNVVDGTWGDWTLQEGDENIFMINNRSGKRYKMALQEVT